MAAQVFSPQKKPDRSMSDVLTIGGGVVGAIYGGPQGAALGAGLGQTAGGLLSSQQAQSPTISSGSDNAMSRRIQSDERLQQLMQAKTAVAQLPPEQQQQYAPSINQAYAMERQRRGIS